MKDKTTLWGMRLSLKDWQGKETLSLGYSTTGCHSVSGAGIMANVGLLEKRIWREEMPAYVVTWVHLIGVVMFIGGWLFFYLVVRPSLLDNKAKKPSEEHVEFTKKIGQRFKTVGWVSLMILIFTGASQLLDESGSARIETSWGLIMMLKLFLFFIVGGLIFVHDLILDPYGGSSKASHAANSPLVLAGKVVWVQRSIVLLSLAILGVAVYLTSI